MKRNWLIILLLCYLTPTTYGQPTADSLGTEELLKQVGRYCSVDPDSALWLADSCLQLANALEMPALLSKTHYLRGVAFKNKSAFPEAQQAYEEAMDIAETLGDSLLLADGIYGLGSLKRHQGDYSQALAYLNRALRIRQENEATETELARTYNGIGGVLYTIGNTRAAIAMFRQSLSIHEGNPKRARFAASTRANIGGMYVELKQPDSALLFLQPALAFYQEQQFPLGIGAAAINLAEAYLLQGDMAKAHLHATMGLENFRLSKDVARQGMALNTAATIAAEEGNYRKAIDFAQQSLDIAEKVGRPDNIRDQYQSLAEFQAAAGQWEEAYQSYRAYATIKDSLFNETVNAQLEAARQEFEAYAKDREIADLRAEQFVQERRRQWLTAGLLLTACFLAYAFWTSYTRRQALKKLQAEQQQTQKLLSEKETLLSELKSAQLQLIQNEKMVSLGQLTAGVAHEINNPLNFVTSNLSALEFDLAELRPVLQQLELLKSQPKKEQDWETLREQSKKVDLSLLNSEIVALLKSIGRGADRMRDIVHSLKVFSRNTSEQFLPADLNEGIRSTITLMKGSLPPYIKIHTHFAALPPVVCQISRLNQVFLNLINNAIQAIPEAGEVTISTELLPGEQVRITVTDTGSGMDEATCRRIFEPFFTTKPVGKGTGLGLSISYGIIKQHQGNIQVESSPEQGTIFHVTVPVQPK